MVGYHGGTAVLAIGEFILGRIAYVDQACRFCKVKMALRAAQRMQNKYYDQRNWTYVQQSRCKRAFHKALFSLVAPSRQLDRVLSDMFEYSNL